MLETILCIVAALITIFVAGLLVKRQKAKEEETRRIEEGLATTLDAIVDEVTNLTGEHPHDRTILYIEKRLDMFNKTLDLIPAPVAPYKPSSYSPGRKKNGKFKTKKYASND